MHLVQAEQSKYKDRIQLISDINRFSISKCLSHQAERIKRLAKKKRVASHGHSSSPPRPLTFMNAEIAPDGTVLGHEQRCKYCARAWELRKYTASQRQGNWRTIDPKVLLEHM